MSTELETSYGGVVLRGEELLVITPAGKRVTGLPKGGMEAGETPEQVADAIFVLVCLANSLEIDLDEKFTAMMEKYRIRDAERWTRK